MVTPGLNIFGFPMAFAIGTDMAHMAGKSLVSTLRHGKFGNVDYRLGFIMVLAPSGDLKSEPKWSCGWSASAKSTRSPLVVRGAVDPDRLDGVFRRRQEKGKETRSVGLPAKNWILWRPGWNGTRSWIRSKSPR